MNPVPLPPEKVWAYREAWKLIFGLLETKARELEAEKQKEPQA
jgi:hypothetical protein